ncbi:DNA-binding protein [Candidatus Poriferisodalis sp.]|uniref:DNA-binding protein n=1 Tax=Candidatus Poriferisodalis sp. TaxID=3101277 RepID=UPI003B014187
MSRDGERRLYAAWRNPDGLIRPVGILTRQTIDDGDVYRFVYLKAAEKFDGFRCLPGLPELHDVYESHELFPVFHNRLMPRSRPDYEDFLQRLALDIETDPFGVLIRCEGWRATDRIEVFAHPERTSDGGLTMLFFVRGIRHLDGASEAICELQPGDALELMDEPTNPVNPRALRLRAGSARFVGWVPDCLVDTVHELRELDASVEVS